MRWYWGLNSGSRSQNLSYNLYSFIPSVSHSLASVCTTFFLIKKKETVLNTFKTYLQNMFSIALLDFSEASYTEVRPHHSAANCMLISLDHTACPNSDLFASSANSDLCHLLLEAARALPLLPFNRSNQMQSIQKDTDLMGKRQNSEERRGN